MKARVIREWKMNGITHKVGEIMNISLHSPGGLPIISDRDAFLLDNGFIEEVNESTRWKPEMGYKYYLLDSNGPVYDDNWDNGLAIDNGRFEIGNCFQTKEEAERAVEKLRSWKRLKDSGLKFKDWNKSNCDKTFCINAEIEHDVVAFDFFKDLRTALDMEIYDEA